MREVATPACRATSPIVSSAGSQDISPSGLDLKRGSRPIVAAHGQSSNDPRRRHMTVTTTRSFDLETLRRGYEEWDIEALLSLYADDVEHIQLDRQHPPAAPLVRRGKEMYRGAFEHCAA